MWLWIDIPIVYLIRALIRAAKVLRGHGWPTSKATVMSATAEDKKGLVYYQYFVNGENYADVDAKPFLCLDRPSCTYGGFNGETN